MVLNDSKMASTNSKIVNNDSRIDILKLTEWMTMTHRILTVPNWKKQNCKTNYYWLKLLADINWLKLPNWYQVGVVDLWFCFGWLLDMHRSCLSQNMRNILTKVHTPTYSNLHKICTIKNSYFLVLPQLKIPVSPPWMTVVSLVKLLFILFGTID